MPTVFDVAQYIVNSLGKISTIKLQKLVYYSKAWSLVWDEDPLFEEEVQAWANGPVVPALYDKHKGMFFSPEKFEGADVSRLSEEQRKTIDVVLDSYSDLSPQGIVALAQSENPWKDARGNIPDYAICNNAISDASIAEFYSSMKV